MLSPKRQTSPHRCIPPGLSARAGFTLVEIVIALAVLGTMAAGVYLGFNSINTYAVSTRLYSEALTAAQNQIDLILSKEPFDTTAAYVSGTFNPCLHKIPVELLTPAELDLVASTTCSDGSGPVTFPTSAPTSTPAASAYYPAYYPYYRTGAGQPLQKQAFIYHDPVSGLDVVKGALTSTVSDTGMAMSPYANTAPGATPSPLNTRKANVSVNYAYRNSCYGTATYCNTYWPTAKQASPVSMDTFRAADQ
ncbi:MAG TPA: prepilin-type N-terminal cleavage/methylation domain-containing protein [Chthoniobacterales bacterium]|nr:prepilin-type N-terminal cleavage/methylation domain-containing protein [Chthoniobacterales bacterium]